MTVAKALYFTDGTQRERAVCVWNIGVPTSAKDTTINQITPEAIQLAIDPTQTNYT